MSGNEGGGGGGSEPGGGGGSSSGGGDIAAIWAYLHHQEFGTNGDYTGNAGYGGDNTGPPGSAPSPGSARPAGDAPAADLAAALLWDWSQATANTEQRHGDSFAVPAATGLWPAFTTLRSPSLLSSPELLAENDVVACNPNRTSCLPPRISDVPNQSSVANELQYELDESYQAVQNLYEGRTRIIQDPAVDVQQLADTAAQLANSDRYRLEYTANLLRDHPIEIRHSAMLTGLGHAAAGGALAVGSGLIIYGSGGLALPLVGATGFASGIATASSGLVLAASGADSTQTELISGQLDYISALTSSPTALVFGTTGLVLSDGDQRISHGFAVVGSLAEGAMSIRGDPSKLYSGLLPGIESTVERSAPSPLLKDVAALGFTSRSEPAAVAVSKLTRELTPTDRLAAEEFRTELANTSRLDLAGRAAHDAVGAAPRGVDFFKYGGAFQQELKLHGPYTPVYDQLLDNAWNQSFQYSIQYQLQTRAIGEQLVPIRSVRHLWVSPTDAVRYLR